MDSEKIIEELLCYGYDKIKDLDSITKTREEYKRYLENFAELEPESVKIMNDHLKQAKNGGVLILKLLINKLSNEYKKTGIKIYNVEYYRKIDEDK